MKFAVLFTTTLAVPIIMGAPLLNTTHHIESTNSIPTTSTAHYPFPDIDNTLSKTPILLLSERGASLSTLESRQHGPPHVFYPPPGKDWSIKTQCAIAGSAMHLPIWITLKHCHIRHNGDHSGNTRIYELCAEEADEEGVSEKDKYMRCERYKGFGK
ncbi:hypothetical protein SVAN01_04807 [Stagonosporopsis vannaccii]|nr:hypothetical protein SVAN01_04807 [Stagonosporopsis vannaccii]